MLKDLIAKMGDPKKVTVGMSVTPNVGLEMIQIDPETRTVVKYGYKPLDYNFSTREIADYDAFKEAAIVLFEEFALSPFSCNVIVNLPNVHFGITDLSLLLPDEAITQAVVSECERNYVFKRVEPNVSWARLAKSESSETQDIAYVGLQANAIDEVVGALSSIGCQVVAIENSVASLIKSLHYAQIAPELFEDNVTWNLVVISSNNYSVASMVGQKIVEYMEEPLPLKSLTGDEIYETIVASAKLMLETLPAQYTFIVSETDLVSADYLSKNLKIDSIIKSFDSNKYGTQSILPVALTVIPETATKISLEAVGAGIYPYSRFPLKFNFYEDGAFALEDEAPIIQFGGKEIELNQAFLTKFTISACGIVLVIAGVTWFVLNFLSKEIEPQIKSKEARINEVNQLVKKYSEISTEETFDEEITIITSLVKSRNGLLYYSALGANAPERLWLTSFDINDKGNVCVKGRSTDIESIYLFYKELKQSVLKSNIKLSKLEMAADGVYDEVVDDPQFYEFEITNMEESELKKLLSLGISQSDTTTTKKTTTSSTKNKKSGSKLPPNLDKIENF